MPKEKIEINFVKENGEKSDLLATYDEEKKEIFFHTVNDVKMPIWETFIHDTFYGKDEDKEILKKILESKVLILDKSIIGVEIPAFENFKELEKVYVNGDRFNSFFSGIFPPSVNFVQISEDFEGSIGLKTFCQSNLKEINIPAGVNEIGKLAFSATKLEKISIPRGVHKIYLSAFSKCDSLREVHIENDVDRIIIDGLVKNPLSECTTVYFNGTYKELTDKTFYDSASTEWGVPYEDMYKYLRDNFIVCNKDLSKIKKDIGKKDNTITIEREISSTNIKTMRALSEFLDEEYMHEYLKPNFDIAFLMKIKNVKQITDSFLPENRSEKSITESIEK